MTPAVIRFHTRRFKGLSWTVSKPSAPEKKKR